MYRPIRLGTALAAIGIALSLTACSSTVGPGHGAASAPASDTAASAGDSGGDSNSGSDSGVQAPASTVAAEPGSGPSNTDRVCPSAQLKVGIAPEDAAAGSRYFTITFENRSDTICHLNGHPGVSAVTGDKGEQLGSSAARGAPEPRRVPLVPGASAHATLKAVNIGEDGGPLAGRCTVESAAGWRIYPPDSKTSVFLRQSGLKVCSSDVEWLTVGSVTK